MEDAQAQLVEKLKSATNVMVTVSRDPSVDQLSALLGLTIFLNKQGKHAAAIFSGQVPSTLEFLQPEETIEKNTDSLRDFIIALDKNKADKLRYKVEDNVVRIFITPYKTSITQDDFEFSQGDFNVDLVIAIGVQRQEDLDEAIVSHGRILHDATVANISNTSKSELGTIHLNDGSASSLSEIVTKLIQKIDAKLLDEQIANALLTGIVAETDRFKNEKTSAETMSASSALMAAGANQQLVASKLGEDGKEVPLGEGTKPGDGAIAIDHAETPSLELPKPAESLPTEAPDVLAEEPDDSSNLSPGAKLITEPPTLGGTLTANSSQQALEPTTDPLSLPVSEPPQLLDHDEPKSSYPVSTVESLPSDNLGPPEPSVPEPPAPPVPPQPVLESPSPPVTELPASITSQLTPPPPAWVPPSDPTLKTEDTLEEIEQTVNSPHLGGQAVDQPIYTALTVPVTPSASPPAVPPIAPPADDSLNDARDEVNKALNQQAVTSPPPEPVQALGATQLGVNLHPDDLPSDPTLPGQTPQPAPPADPNAPPPVPPPIPFNFGNPPSAQ